MRADPSEPCFQGEILAIYIRAILFATTVLVAWLQVLVEQSGRFLLVESEHGVLTRLRMIFRYLRMRHLILRSIPI